MKLWKCINNRGVTCSTVFLISERKPQYTQQIRARIYLLQTVKHQLLLLVPCLTVNADYTLCTYVPSHFTPTSRLCVHEVTPNTLLLHFRRFDSDPEHPMLVKSIGPVP